MPAMLPQLRALCHEWNSWAGMKEPVTGIFCCVPWMGHWDFLGWVWMNFSRAEGAHVTDPSEVGACGECRSEAGQDLLECTAGFLYLPTVVLQGVGHPFEHKSFSS